MPRNTRPCANIFELQALEIRRFLTTASLSSSTHTLNITGTSSGETITLNQGSNGRVSITGVSTTYVPGSGSGQFNKININAAGGNDTIQINGNVAYTNATLGGGSGNDVMIGGSKADQFSGGTGFDTANYSLRTSKVTVSINGSSDDGASGEGDNVQSDTEEVIGGSAGDSFTGDDAHDNFFAGGSGNDTAKGNGGNDDLTGSTGNDSLEGNAGSDFLQAKNNDVDTVKGGSGTGDVDLAEVDGIDVSFSAFAPTASVSSPTIDRTQLDPTYNDPNGTSTGTGTNTGPDLNWLQVSASTIDSQGRVILVGSASRTNGAGYSSEDMVAVRYDANGNFDEGFGYGGEAAIDFTTNTGAGYGDIDQAFGVTTDSNGNIYIVGSSYGGAEQRFNYDFAVAKLDSNGDPVSSFGTDGHAVFDVTGFGYNDEAHDAAVDQNGNVVLVGTTNFSDIAVMRIDSNGIRDGAFNFERGYNTLDVGSDNGVAVGFQEFGAGYGGEKIVVGGTSDDRFIVARFNEDGSLDNPFGNGYGYQNVSFSEGSQSEILNDIAVDPNNNIFAVGEAVVFVAGRNGETAAPYSGASGLIAKYDDSGNLLTSNEISLSEDDLSFSSVVYDTSNDLLVVGGATSTDFAFAEVDPNSLAISEGFNGGSLVTLDFSPDSESNWLDAVLEVGVTSDGKILLGGYSDTNGDGGYQTSVARYGKETDTGPHDDVEGIEDFVSDDELFANPPAEPLASRLKNLSTGAKLYILAQPDSNGVAHFDLTNANDTVTIYNGFDDNGNPQVFVNVNTFVIPYDPGSTTLFRFNLMGGNDSLVTSPGVTIPMIVNAGDGNDLVRTGDGNDIIDGGKGIDIAYGGKGNDVVKGGADTDVIGGDEGNDLVIGGTGVDGLFGGGSGEDILIGGTTAYDSNEAALIAIIDEWGSGASNADRIDHLRGTLSGGLNLTYFLKVGSGATVFNDTSVDGLTGGSGRDWFFRKLNNPQRDSILDNLTGEEVTNM
jgi:uncharacterized delta-60 repeat protein